MFRWISADSQKFPGSGKFKNLSEKTDSAVVDYDLLRRRINELGERYHIREIAIDC